jgi:hypothetical protein
MNKTTNASTTRTGRTTLAADPATLLSLADPVYFGDSQP